MRVYAIVDGTGRLIPKYKSNAYYVRKSDADKKARRLNLGWQGKRTTYTVKTYELVEVVNG